MVHCYHILCHIVSVFYCLSCLLFLLLLFCVFRFCWQCISSYYLSSVVFVVVLSSMFWLSGFVLVHSLSDGGLFFHKVFVVTFQQKKVVLFLTAQKTRYKKKNFLCGIIQCVFFKSERSLVFIRRSQTTRTATKNQVCYLQQWVLCFNNCYW